MKYLRTTDLPALIAAGVQSGVIAETPDGHGVGANWIFIGPIYKATGSTVMQDGVQIPVKAPMKDGGGKVYIHANLVSDTLPEALKPFEIAAPATPDSVLLTV